MSGDKQLLNIVRIYLDNPNDRDMERTLESYSNKNNTVKLYHKIKDLERQLEEAERKEKAYIDFCNSLFFDLDPKDKRLLKLREQLKEQGDEQN